MDDLETVLKKYPDNLSLTMLTEILNAPVGRVSLLMHQRGFPKGTGKNAYSVPKDKFIEWVGQNAGKKNTLPRQVIASVPEDLKIDDLPIFLRPSTVSNVLGLSLSRSTDLLKEKGCPSIRVGNRILVPKGEFFSWLAENPKYGDRNRYRNRVTTKIRVAEMIRSGTVNLDDLPDPFNTNDLRAVFGLKKSSAYDLISARGFPKLQTGNCFAVPKEKFLGWLKEE